MKTTSHFVMYSFVISFLLSLLNVTYADTGIVKSSMPGSPMMEKPSVRIESQLNQLQADLKLTPQQEIAWSAYADFQRQAAKNMDQKFTEFQKQHAPMGAMNVTGSAAHISVLDMLQLQRERLNEASNHLDALIAATKQFYAALTPEQQARADGILLPHRVIIVTTPPAVPALKQ